MDVTQVSEHPGLAVATVALVVAVLVGLAAVGWRLARGRPADEILTPIAAMAATAMAMSGMWKFFGDVLDAPAPLRVALFAFLELAMVTSAVRARRNVREHGTAGADGAAVWVITGLSALLSATDAGSLRAALLRFAAPILAAWLWERGLSVERRRTGHARRIHLRLTPERILVRLGIAEAGDRTATDVEVHRRLARLARAAHTVRRLRATGARPGRQRRAMARLYRAMDGAVEHAGLATDPRRRAALLDQIAALYHAPALADLAPPTPWTAPALDQPPATADPTALPAGPRTDADPTDARTGTRAFARTGEPSPRTNGSRTRPEKTNRRTGEPVDRDQVVADLVAEIHAAMDTGKRWTPDYPSLMARTGFRRSWCEKVVRDARNIALRTGSDNTDTTPANDAGAGQVVPLSRTARQ